VLRYSDHIINVRPSHLLDSPLRLAVDVPFEPFQYRLPDGTLTGFEVELGEEVCRRFERECEWVEQGWVGKEIDIEGQDALEGLSVGVQRGTIRDAIPTAT
jgi:arginine/ornithine transport system substrate-binding protein